MKKTFLFLTAILFGLAAGAQQVEINPADADGKFTIAIMPDTQNESNQASGLSFTNRSQWLVDNKDVLDLRFVAHGGDVVNWGWLDQPQYNRAVAGMKILEDARIPYQLAIGNHDSRVVGYNNNADNPGPGGSAVNQNPHCPLYFQNVGMTDVTDCKTDPRLTGNKQLRMTQEFNAAFTADRYGAVAGVFEAGKVDNIYSTFSAGGKQWLVLTLEFHARDAAIQWAKTVVASHPTHNVIIVSHSILNSALEFEPGNAGYGNTTGIYLRDQLILEYPNIVATFCGHTGNQGSREDIGKHGNKVISYLTAIHAGSTLNPVRLVEIDVNAKTFKTWIYQPINNTTTVTESTRSGINFVLPVTFGTISATLKTEQLLVSWQTLKETNNSYFEIEASADGKNFTKIGQVLSQAANGNSSLPLDYEFGINPGGTSLAMMGIGLLLLGGMGIGISHRKKYLFMLLATAGIGLSIAGCDKNELSAADNNALYVRIKQVDKDRGFEYSKVVKAEKE